MNNDAELLGRFAREGSEAAYRELVQRHLGFVQATALRLVAGDTHLAEDVAQVVFIDLARKAGTLPRKMLLAGWLYEATRFAAAKAVRLEQRRRAREQEAMAMQDPTPETPSDVELLRPALDAALAELNLEERNALLLRFFQGNDLRTVGAAFGISDDAAQKRIQRALEKLRNLLVRRGLTLSATALASALPGITVSSASAGLATSIATVALTVSATTPGPGLVAYLMTAEKARAALAVLLAGTLLVPLILQYQAKETLRRENAALRTEAQALGEMEKLRAENQRLAALQAEAEEVQRARSNHLELLRLRGEHGELLQLRREVARLRGLLATRTTLDAQPGLPLAPENASRIACLNNVRLLCVSLTMYVDDHRGIYPEASRWCEALLRYYQATNFLRCPSNPARPCAYAFNGKLSGLSETNITYPSDTVVFFEAEAEWNGVAGMEGAVARHEDIVIVGFADGSSRGVRKNRLQELIWDPKSKR